MNVNLPNKHDKLFQEEMRFDYEDWLKKPANKFFLYSQGYKEAGKLLYEYCVDNSFYWNTLIYPLIFNYRQFIELRLKELIIMGYSFIEDEKDFADTHSLSKLWNTYRTEILIHIETIDEEILNNVEKIISQFNSEDPKSMCFRYPVTTAPRRQKSLSRDTIDIKNFKKVIDKLIYFFDWQWEMISYHQDLKEEMIAEMYQSYWR